MSDIMELVGKLRQAAIDIRNDGTASQVGLTDEECNAIASTIERLVADVQEMTVAANDYAHQAARSEIRAQSAESRCERLEEALKPFADQADELNEASPDNRDIWENPVAMSITFGDLRRAREALEPKP